MSWPNAAALLLSVLAVSASASAPAQEPPWIAPPTLRVHIVAHEALDPDLLHALARPQTVLFLRTSSNAVRASALERAARFARAFVELRPPLSSGQLEELASAPKVGAWVSWPQAKALGLFRLGTRPLAVELQGPLDAATADEVHALHPAHVRWTSAGPPDLAAFSALTTIGGQRVLRFPGAKAELCQAGLPRGWPPQLELELDPTEPGAPPSCDLPILLRPRGAPTFAQVRPWLERYPSAELELEVGADAARARNARELLSALFDAPRAPRVP